MSNVKRPPVPRVNGGIRVVEVRLVGPTGNQMGIFHLPDALRIARENDMDLVEVASEASPPVCRIMDYGKYKYEQKKQTQESRKKQTFIQLKEVKFRPKTFEHDIAFKVDHIKRFLEHGDKAKISIFFRGREIAYTDRGRAILMRVIEDVKDFGTPEFAPRMLGKVMWTVLTPKSKK